MAKAYLRPDIPKAVTGRDKAILMVAMKVAEIDLGNPNNTLTVTTAMEWFGEIASLVGEEV